MLPHSLIDDTELLWSYFGYTKLKRYKDIINGNYPWGPLVNEKKKKKKKKKRKAQKHKEYMCIKMKIL